jgi:hypothetical protein
VSVHAVYVVEFAPDVIEVSDRVPEWREGYDRLPESIIGRPIPFKQELGRRLFHLLVEGDRPPILPDGDLTGERYREWLSLLDAYRVEGVDSDLIVWGYEGLCVRVDLAAVDAEVHGTVLEARVTNVGPYPIGPLSVRWQTQLDPEPGRSVTGEGFAFVSVGAIPDRLEPGETRKFALLRRELQHCLRHFDSHPSDAYHLSVVAAPPGMSAVREIRRVRGRDLGYMARMLKNFARTEGQ